MGSSPARSNCSRNRPVECPAADWSRHRRRAPPHLGASIARRNPVPRPRSIARRRAPPSYFASGSGSRTRDVDKKTPSVLEQAVGPVAKCHEEIHIAVLVIIHPDGLTRGTVQIEPECRCHIRKMSSIIAIEPRLRAHRGGETQEQVGIPVAVVVAPCGSSCLEGDDEASRRRDVPEAPGVIAIEPIGCAAESDKEVKVAVSVVICPRVRLCPGRSKERRLDARERQHCLRWRRGRDDTGAFAAGEEPRRQHYSGHEADEH